MTAEAELTADRAHVAVLYARLDTLRARTAEQLAQVRRSGALGSPQNRSERDAFATLYEDTLARLRAADDRLAFGRLDLRDGERRYVGRIGLADDEHRQLLLDWRAPAAEPFYRATAASPGDVVRRRHLMLRGREVVGVEDEVLDLDALGHAARSSLGGEAALLAAVTAHRTGRMGDIVATIQAEQDRVIRADLAGTLVVQGGPGTGKTAVALHRAAYLLYTYRERLARSGVLLVGPSPVFLRYIEQVLPSLGETGVVLASSGELFPGVRTDRHDAPEVAALKGDPRMAGVLARAVRARQRVPDRTLTLDVNGQRLTLTPAAVDAAISRARRSRKPHNVARVTFVREMLKHLAHQLARTLGTTFDSDDQREAEAELRAARAVRVALNTAWLPATPQQLLEGLFADPARLAAAAPHLSAAQRRLLSRAKGAPWTVSDVPLLDEAAELLGEDDSAAQAAATRAAAQRQADLRYARDVLESGAGPASGMVSAEVLADRFAEEGPLLSVAERAARDRTWAFGHVVVDEAQELSPMMWRLLMRRCPNRSMTVVGDVAQTGSPAGTHSWAAALDPFVGDRWRMAELTVNYRTPAQVMAVAAAVLAAAGIDATPPTSVREGDWPPEARRVPPGEVSAVIRAVERLLPEIRPGRLAVIAPTAGFAALAAALCAALPGVAAAGATAIDAPVAVLPVTAAKGLEFDAVILCEPAQILAESPQGANDLYVALTRPTQRLLVLHSDELPRGMQSLAAGDAPTAAAADARRVT